MNIPSGSSSNAPVPSDPPIAAPESFKYLDEQLNKMNTTLDEPEEESVSDASKPISAVTKETKKSAPPARKKNGRDRGPGRTGTGAQSGRLRHEDSRGRERLGVARETGPDPGQAADVTQAQALMEGVPFEVVIGDRGYDSQAVVQAVEARGGEAVIPSQKNRKVQRSYDRERYKDRNLVERFWAKVKQYRRVATRYAKTARNFLAMVHVASILLR